jgi:chromosome segregation ATPase
LKSEKGELSNNYRDQVEKIHTLLEEKDKIYSELDSMRNELNKISQEKDKINIEKEKLVLLKNKHEDEIEAFNALFQKIENEKSSASDKFSKSVNKLEKERESLVQERKSQLEKNELLTNEKSLLSKELEYLKLQENNNKGYIEKLESTNKSIFAENQKHIIEIEKLKFSNDILQKSKEGKEKKSSLFCEKSLLDSNEISTNFNTNSFSNCLNTTLLNSNKNNVYSALSRIQL